MLLTSPVKDAQRDSSICFELKHSSAVTQFARLLAHKRELPVDVCAAGALLHDIYVITSGSYTDHAHRGVPIARAMLARVGGFSAVEIDEAERIVGHHSDKHIFSADPFVEFGKDVDVLDAFLYPGAFDWYLGNKPLPIFRHYLSRAAAVWTDLGLVPDSRFHLLDDYDGGWLAASCDLPATDLRGLLRDRRPSCRRAWFCETVRNGSRNTARRRGSAWLRRHGSPDHARPSATTFPRSSRFRYRIQPRSAA